MFVVKHKNSNKLLHKNNVDSEGAQAPCPLKCPSSVGTSGLVWARHAFGGT